MRLYGRKKNLLRPLSACALCAALIACFLLVVNIEGKRSEERQAAAILTSVRGAAVSCFASEGAYPQNIEYLREHYGVAYDENRYLVVYDAFASNIPPAIRVLRRGVAQ